MPTSEATIEKRREDELAAFEAVASMLSRPSATVQESVFHGYVARAVKEWVLAGRPRKR